MSDKPEVASSSFPVCRDSLGHTDSLLYYDFGSYDQSFRRYSAKKGNYAKIMATLPQHYGNPITIGQVDPNLWGVSIINNFYSYLQPFGRSNKKKISLHKRPPPCHLPDPDIEASRVALDA